MRPAAQMAGNTHGEITMGEAIWRISRIKNTVFAWSDREIDDGYPESSPVGAFPFRSEPVRHGRYGGQCLGVVPGLSGTVSRHSQGKPSWTGEWNQTCLSRWQLEVALQQPARDRSGLPTCRTTLATISDSESCANASKQQLRATSYDGLKRNFVRPRFAFALALRRLFWLGVSNARKRRTSSRIPSASSLFFSRFSARSTGSPLRTITSGMIGSSFEKLFPARPVKPSLLGRKGRQLVNNFPVEMAKR